MIQKQQKSVKSFFDTCPIKNKLISISLVVYLNRNVMILIPKDIKTQHLLII